MAEIRRNVKNIQQSGFLLVGVDVSKAKDDACPRQGRFAKNEEAREWVTYLFSRGRNAGHPSTLRSCHYCHNRMTRGQCGSLLLHCMNLSFTTPFRF